MLKGNVSLNEKNTVLSEINLRLISRTVLKENVTSIK
jgi:hypothetical protein